MASRQPDEEAIFHVAREIENLDTRARYLDQICAGDRALRERVEALLRVHEQEREFLKSVEAGAALTADASPLIEQPGTVIGRYRLMEQIGEGGMGTVFVAEQQRPLQRKVALKVIKPGMDSKAVVARFEAERQALALMDHTNIARVFDAGTTDSGRPYFVMELVRGIPITDYCDQNKLTIRQRLDLFIQVCQAIQHAHQKGIIHRDIKPSNVLVTLHDGTPVPKVIDFGVAKALHQRLTERTIYTSFAQIVGTPLYMSPEQAELSGLDIDTRTDVYALGVLLYELLTGATPFDKHQFEQIAYDEIRRIIRETEPSKPSTKVSSLGQTAMSVSAQRGTDPRSLSGALTGDLDVIVMKALEKDRNRRYDTASGFADDVRRYLDDQPILARSPSLAYRVAKFSRRYRWAITIATLFVGVLLAGIGTTTWLWREARGQAENAKKQETIANEQAARADREAEAAYKTATDLRATLNELRTELVHRALGEALAGDLDAIGESLRRAKQSQARDEVVATLWGLAYLNAGRIQDAILSLEDARHFNPDDLGALAASFWVHQNAGHYGEATRFILKVYELQATGAQPRDDYEQLLISQFRVFALNEAGLRSLIAKLGDIIARRGKWGLAYSARADARRELAKRTRRMEDVDSARADAVLAMRYQPENPTVITSGLYATLVALELAEFQKAVNDTRVNELRAEGARLADQLEPWKTHFHAQGIRVAYFLHVGQTEKAEADRLAMVAGDTPNDQVLAARALVSRDSRELDALLARKPDSLPFRAAAGVRHVIEGNPERALEDLDSLFRDFVAADQRWILLDIALIARRPDMARKHAKQALKEWRDAGELTNSSPWDIPILRFYADEISEAELLEFAGPFHFEHVGIVHPLGLWRFAIARSPEELDAAEVLLRDATKCAYPGWWTPLFSSAYLQLIEDGRLAPIATPETGSTAIDRAP